MTRLHIQQPTADFITLQPRLLLTTSISILLIQVGFLLRHSSRLRAYRLLRYGFAPYISTASFRPFGRPFSAFTYSATQHYLCKPYKLPVLNNSSHTRIKAPVLTSSLLSVTHRLLQSRYSLISTDKVFSQPYSVAILHAVSR